MSKKRIIYVGNKPTMKYILAIVTQINNGTSIIVLKARGKAINRAVDVAEIVRNNFIPNIEVKNVEIGTEELTKGNGSSVNVSSIVIELIKDPPIPDLRIN